MPPSNKFAAANGGLLLEAALVPWDTGVFDYPVAQIERIQVLDPDRSRLDYAAFESWRDANLCGLVSCRLRHDRLQESMLLEEKGFRFIETVLHPRLERLDRLDIPDQGLTIARAEQDDIPALRRIAESAFEDDRFHVDPRLDRRCADLRYGRWVASTPGHPRQQLLKITDDDALIALFIIEAMEDGGVYWHLTTISPAFQNRGYGRRTWLAMLRHHAENGHSAVSTTISARNIAVLNLYSGLSFRFSPPEMTFHWIKG
jgi:RimJ/RimL family protein N-acetyltransferase